jgi:GNAT superfamily N-acetyltransferase
VSAWTIRDALPGEAAALAEVQLRASSVWESDRALLAAHPDLIEPPEEAVATGRVRVAVDAAGRLLGFCVVVLTAEAVEIDDLFVEPSAMGRGIGRSLVDDAVLRAGSWPVEATVNANAVGFYERLGFQTCGEAETIFGPAPRMRLERL